MPKFQQAYMYVYMYMYIYMYIYMFSRTCKTMQCSTCKPITDNK